MTAWPTSTIDRRALLKSGAAAAALAALPLPAWAREGMFRTKLGTAEIVTLFDGSVSRKIDASFVRNAPFEEVQKALADAGMNADAYVIPFTQTVFVNGNRRVLIDTGTGGQFGPTTGKMLDNMQAAGLAPAQIDTIVISHFHPDHINGIKTKDNALAFPNAEIHVPAAEWAHWMDDARMNAAPEAARGTFANVRRIFGDIAERVKRFDWGKEVAPGITAVDASGHTPGHTAFALASGGKSAMALADVTNRPELFARYPDWQVMFDSDGEKARLGRRKLLDMAATEKMLVTGYHFPSPAAGTIVKDGNGYRYVAGTGA